MKEQEKLYLKPKFQKNWRKYEGARKERKKRESNIEPTGKLKNNKLTKGTI